MAKLTMKEAALVRDVFTIAAMLDLKLIEMPKDEAELAEVLIYLFDKTSGDVDGDGCDLVADEVCTERVTEKRKIDWPFKRMAVGDVEIFKVRDSRKAVLYAHSYAKATKKKFRTMTDPSSGRAHIRRVR